MATTPEQNSPQRRARPKSRVMSWGGGGHSGDGSQRPQVDRAESSREKARSRLSMTTKADPTKAITEQQPGQVAFDESTMGSLRGIQHKDAYGNLITDPDRSNPTRPRMERPLDTIRSFEDAMDGGSNRRYPPRPDTTEPAGFASRRSSYHQGFGPMHPQQRYQDEGISARGYSGHPAINGNYYGSHSPAPMRDPRRMVPRHTPDPHNQYQNGYDNGLYGNSRHQQSYDSATTASGSGRSYGTEPWADSTDPSSQNSSFDRLQHAPPPPPKADAGEQYGFTGFGNGPDLQQRTIMEEQYGYDEQHGGYDQRGYDRDGYDRDGYARDNYSQMAYGSPAYQNGYQNGYGNPQGAGAGEMAPPPPPHNAKAGLPRNSSKLQSSRRQVQSPPQQYDAYGAPVQSPNGGEKRKSWLQRRFSKNKA